MRTLLLTILMTTARISVGFFGQRLRAQRFIYGLSQSELAEKAGLAASMISRLEQNERAPGEDVIRQLCHLLEVTPKFFATKLFYETIHEDVHFRHRARTPARERNIALGHATLLFEVLDFFEANLRLPHVSLPSRPTVVDPTTIEHVACEARACVGLPNDRPLASLVGTLESAGIPVVLSSETSECVDAFSVFRVPRPIIVLNKKDSGSRVNFTGAHELGHLILHQGRETGDRETESEADRFASAFLMPARAFAREFPRSSRGTIDWQELLPTKQRWRVSMQAIIRRAFDLGLISAIVYRRACQHASSQGWRRASPGEPGEFASDGGAFISDCFDVAARTRGVQAKAIAERLAWPVPLLRRVVCANEDDPRFSEGTREQGMGAVLFIASR